MHESHVTVTAISFLISLALYIWPRRCRDQFRRMLEKNGEEPDRRLKLREMKAMDLKLYRRMIMGLIICLPFTAVFIAFAVLLALH